MEQNNWNLQMWRTETLKTSRWRGTSGVSSGDRYDTCVGYFGDADIDGDGGGGHGGGVDWNLAKSLVGLVAKASLFSTKAMREPIPGWGGKTTGVHASLHKKDLR